jgi:hypothetical protein
MVRLRLLRDGDTLNRLSRPERRKPGLTSRRRGLLSRDLRRFGLRCPLRRDEYRSLLLRRGLRDDRRYRSDFLAGLRSLRLRDPLFVRSLLLAGDLSRDFEACDAGFEGAIVVSAI